MHSDVFLGDLLATQQDAFTPTSYRRCVETIARLQRYLARDARLADIDDESLERLFGSMVADRMSSLVVKRDRRLLLKLRNLAKEWARRSHATPKADARGA